jgi:hypothetical protein
MRSTIFSSAPPGSTSGTPEARASTSTRARLAERGAVRGLLALAQHLVHVLVRHLVLQDLDHRGPRPLEDQGPRDLDRARGRHPAPQVRARRDELERRRSEPALEERVVDLPPRGPQLAHERRFERCREVLLPLHGPAR